MSLSGTMVRMATVALVATKMAMTMSGAALAQPLPADQAALYEKAKVEKKVTFYMGSPADPMKRFIGAFEKRYPGVTVEFVRLVGTQLSQRFMQEYNAKQYIADIVLIADMPALREMVRLGAIAKWKVPSDARFEAQYKFEGAAYAPYLTNMSLVYNKNKLNAEEIKLLRSGGWNAVTDPRFRGRFAASPIACGICYAGVQMFLATPGYGEAFLKKVADNKPVVFASTVVGLDRVIAGEVGFIFWSFENAALPAFQSGAPIEWIHPEPTAALPNSWLGLAERGPAPNGARLFMNWFLSEEGARSVQEELGAQSTISGVPDRRAVTKQPWYNRISKKYTVDFERWDAKYDSEMKIWQDILAGRAK